MDEDELKQLIGISNDDQSTSEMKAFTRNIATSVIAYYRQLITEGIGPAESLKLTEGYQTAYISMIGGMVAIQNAMKGKQ